MKKKILILSSIFIIIDQVLKVIVRSNLNIGIEEYVIPNFFYLTYAKNTGGAFSVLENNPIILAVIGGIALIWLIHMLLNKEDINKIEGISYSILIGGIIGNFIDRIIFSNVTDYIGIKIFDYYYPVFNFADIGIVVGIILLLILEIRGGKDGTRSN